jgi:tetratricopeptide (TPR) repeat protein
MQRHLARSWTLRALLVLASLLFVPAFSARAAAASPKSILDDPDFRTEVRQGLDRLYDMDFTGANAHFAAIEQRYPGHPVGPFLRALHPWWEILVDPDDDTHDDAFFDAMDEVIRRCDRRLKADPRDLDGMFFKSGALAFRGRLQSDRKHWLRAALDGRKALQLLEDVRKVQPDNPDLLLGIGLFDYLSDVAPSQYPILKPFTRFFPKGDRARGLQEIATAVERGAFVPTEAVLAREAAGRPGYRGDVTQQALYVLGRDEVRWRQFADALPHLSRLEILNTRGDTADDYRAYGRLYRGMALDALGRREEAVYWYNRALDSRPPGEVRDKARNYLRAPYLG